MIRSKLTRFAQLQVAFFFITMIMKNQIIAIGGARYVQSKI